MIKYITFVAIAINTVIGSYELSAGNIPAGLLLITLSGAMVIVTVRHLKEMRRLDVIKSQYEADYKNHQRTHDKLLEEWRLAGGETLQEMCEKKKAGVWFVRSQIDPRWNAQGGTHWLVSLGMPPEAHAWIEECQTKFDVGPIPSDLMYGFEKY